ncbi:MAG: PAS domain S-box protein [Nitrospira sp.]|nr:PAS domain S-box protein [Nitrospira sp.]
MSEKSRPTRKPAARAKPSQSKPARRSARTVKKPVSRERPQRPSWFSLPELQAIKQLSPLASVCLDVDGKVVSWNKAAETLFGWTEAEVLGLLEPLAAAPGLRLQPEPAD